MHSGSLRNHSLYFLTGKNSVSTFSFVSVNQKFLIYSTKYLGGKLVLYLILRFGCKDLRTLLCNEIFAFQLGQSRDRCFWLLRVSCGVLKNGNAGVRHIHWTRK